MPPEPHQPSEQVTAMLAQAAAGDRLVAGDLFLLVQPVMRALAAHALGSERRDHTLQPTALVDEAFMKLIDQHRALWHDRNHFYAVAADCMRKLLVDHARGHNAQKRGGGARMLCLDDQHAIDPVDPAILDLDRALTKFESLDPIKAFVFQQRFFGGRTMNEIAQMVGRSLRSVDDDWSKAKMWLSVELGPAYA